MEGLFKPLPDYVKADIATVLEDLKFHTSSFQGVEINNSDTLKAFNRLITELHVTSESSREALQTSENYRHDLNATDKLLNDAGLESGPTVARVKKLIDRNVKATAQLRYVLDTLCGKNVT